VIQPIGREQQAAVLAATHDYISLAERHLARDFARIPVTFDLSGRCAGMFRVEGHRCWIRYNPWIFGKYYRENLEGTVPHEVAHYIVHRLYGTRRVKPHGLQWQRVMQLFGADPEVTFRLDLSGIPQRRQRTHNYHCGCREHELSTTRHNRSLRGEGRYQCRYCQQLLVYQGD
jgi:SprT protein